MTKRTFTILVLAFSAGMINAQASKTSDLFLTLKKQDSIFFERGFNLCDLEYLSQDIHTSRAKFTHLYLLENGHWLLKEVLSFDHKEPSETGKASSSHKE